MISEIIIPDLGATGGDAVLEDWLVKPGEQVAAGQPLFVVTTDKATVEVEAFRDGVLREIRVKTGETVALGTVVALIADSIDEPLETVPPVVEAQALPEAETTTPEAGPAPKPPANRILVTPVARRRASEAGVDLASISGTGRQGQILRRDVEAAIRAQSPMADPSPGPPGLREPLSPMRQAIAQRTIQSNRDVPHFYAGVTIDMTAALALRADVLERAEAHDWAKPTITDLCLRAAALTLREYPILNASFIDNAIERHPPVNLGFIVGLEDGMLIPVIRDAVVKNLYDLAAETKRLKAGALAGRLRSEDLSGGTFTVSNLGMYGLDWFAAIINPPEAGMLALGAVITRPAVVQDELVPRMQMDVTLAVDHRLVDGILAAQFLAKFKALLEHPMDLVIEGSGGQNP